MSTGVAPARGSHWWLRPAGMIFAAYLAAPPQGNRLSLFFLLSAAAFFLKGIRVGLGWLAAIIAAIVLGYLVQGSGSKFSGADLGTAILYLVALAGVFYFHETLKSEELARQREHDLRRELRVVSERAAGFAVGSQAAVRGKRSGR